MRENLSAGFSTKRVSIQSPETNWKINGSLEARLDIVLSNKRITKALTRLGDAQAGLRLCCSQTTEDWVSRVKAHFQYVNNEKQSVYHLNKTTYYLNREQSHSKQITHTCHNLYVDAWHAHVFLCDYIF